MRPVMDDTHDLSSSLSVLTDVGAQPVVNYGSAKNLAVATNQYGFVFNNYAAIASDGPVQSAIAWLNAPDPRSDFDDARDKRLTSVEGGVWFIDGPDFDTWKRSTSSFLWLHGIPGSGKTVLCATILESVQKQCTKNEGSVCLYFFFKYDDERKRRYEYMVRSLVLQLCLSCNSFPKVLLDLHTSCMLWKRAPSAAELLQAAAQIIDHFEHVYLVIDALDECSDRRELLQALEMVSKWQSNKLHILTTSRDLKDIQDFMAVCRTIETDISLSTHLVNEDIRAYVNEILKVDRDLSRWKQDLEAQELIRSTLVRKSNGMFRWVACQLDELRGCYDFPRLQYALEALPPSLEETYARILSQIPSAYQADALKLLRCLVVAARPLTLREAVEIVAICPERRPHFSARNRLPEPEDIVLMCPSLISIVNERYIENGLQSTRQVIRLAHFSVQEYITSDRIASSEAEKYLVEADSAHAIFAQLCAAYLMQLGENISSGSQVLLDFPLARYAARYWTHHAAAGEVHARMSPMNGFYTLLPYPQLLRRTSCLLRRLLLQVIYLFLLALSVGAPKDLELDISTRLLCSHDHLLCWHRICDADYPEKDPDFTKERTHTASPLYYAAISGLTTTVRRLLDMGHCVNERGGRYGFPLTAACLGGHLLTASLLLDHGADCNALGGDCGSALYAAADKGHKEVVKLLLDCGANVAIRGGSNGQALATAAEKGHLEVVTLLLQRGAGIHAKEGRCGSALQAAVAEGHQTVARYLIEHGADVNASGGVYRTTILAAVWPGHGKVLSLLLDNGIDFDKVDDLYSNALYGAAHQGHEAIVAELLARKADIRGQHPGYGTPLYAAALNGFLKIAQVLLDHDDDDDDVSQVNQEGGNYGTPLQAAARNGDAAMVRLLLDHGADIDQESGFYGTALFAAYDNNHGHVAEILQQARIARGLQVTVEVHPEMMSRLDLTTGMEHCFARNVHPHSDSYGNLLQAAICQGEQKIVQKLLDRGVLADSQGKGFGKPLYTASARGQESIVRLLVEAGADPNGISRGYGSALQAAANNGHSAIVQHLLDKGAEVNLRSGLHDSALHAAAYESHEGIVKQLLDHGADVNAKAVRWKTTPLQAACWGGNEKIAALLLERGAKPDAPGGSWGSASQAASLRRHDAISALLKKYMPP